MFRYGTEREVGAAITAYLEVTRLPRSALFVTTKVYQNISNVTQVGLHRVITLQFPCRPEFFPQVLRTLQSIENCAHEVLTPALCQYASESVHHVVLFHTGDTRCSYMQACEESLRRLGLDYVDLYLIHAPFRPEMQLDKVGMPTCAVCLCAVLCYVLLMLATRHYVTNTVGPTKAIHCRALQLKFQYCV